MRERKSLILSTWRWACGILLTVLKVGAASLPVPWDDLPNVSLPPPSFADLETTTNVPLPNLARQSGRFVFSLGCLATPTNNVEVAFGTDENANGELEPEEIDLIVGWDAGRWRVRRDFVDVASSPCSNLVGQVRTLTWALDVDANGVPVGLEASAGEVPLFPRLVAQSPAWLHKASWNMARLTGRGLERHEDSFRFGFVGADGAILQNEKLKVENEKLSMTTNSGRDGVPPPSAADDGTPALSLSQGLLPTVSDDDIAAGWRLDAVGEAEAGFAAQRPANAVVNESWRIRGAHIDGFRIPAVDWMFRSMHEGYLDGLTVCSWGEIRPHIATNYFPRPFPEADLSLLPLAKWGLLPPNVEESLFWHATTPSNSLMLTWRNAAYGRDANCPTNFQAEIFPDGGFVYRYEDRTERYVAVSPWDWDGDGLENSVDPDPKTAGPDAHGTNAEWYDTVCSNVFTKINSNNPNSPNNPNNSNNFPIALPNGETIYFKSGVNTNAYYFIDVVAADGPAPVYFNADRSSRLGSPVVMALAGATNHVPLLIGVEYAVTSPAPFTVSVPTNGFAEVVSNNGSSSAFTVKWPLEFTFTEGVSSTGRSYTVDVGPCNPDGAFSWGWNPGGASLQGVAPSTTGGACSCVSANGNTVTFGCSSSCACGGSCRAVGAYSFEYAVFTVTGGECRCGFDDPPASEQPTFEFSDPATVVVSFSAPAVIFEDAYIDSFDPTKGTSVTQPRRSTRTRLTVSAWGGPNGGTLTLSSQNLDKLAPVACGPMLLPPQVTLAPYQQWSVSYLCEGEEESAMENDIGVTGNIVENNTSRTQGSSNNLTVVRVKVDAFYTAPGNESAERHRYGIGEKTLFHQYPDSPLVNLVARGATVVGSGGARIIEWSSLDETHKLLVQLGDVTYSPLLEIVYPNGIIGCAERAITYGLPPGSAGGLTLAQRYRVLPLDVSFAGIEVEEIPVPPEEAIPPTGYFVFTPESQFPRTHNSDAGAGQWVRIQEDNYMGGENAHDSAGTAEELPRMQPNGTPTTDTSFGWLGGSLTWKVPFGWRSSAPTQTTSPLGRFAEGTRQMIAITPDGDFSVQKLGHTATRHITGEVVGP